MSLIVVCLASNWMRKPAGWHTYPWFSWCTRDAMVYLWTLWVYPYPYPYGYSVHRYGYRCGKKTRGSPVSRLSYEMMACLLILHRTEDAEQIDDHLMKKFWFVIQTINFMPIFQDASKWGHLKRLDNKIGSVLLNAPMNLQCNFRDLWLQRKGTSSERHYTSQQVSWMEDHIKARQWNHCKGRLEFEMSFVFLLI